ncbi:site-specific integrase [Saccharopolyspora karakumensis]|uniref:site-specific integrase n=1 Tax=Saccharopolyspora karakumensis TaxID=2530386 RepID=UPI001F22C91B|nr:hypothetical protein [Saccharopolyspora karakumensis]
MIEIRSAATAVNKHKALRVFFGWPMNDEREIDRSPMERVRKPATPAMLIPVIEGDVTSQLLATCSGGRDFLSLRDQAIIRLFANTGARLSEVASPPLDDLDLKTESETETVVAQDVLNRSAAKVPAGMDSTHVQSWDPCGHGVLYRPCLVNQ